MCLVGMRYAEIEYIYDILFWEKEHDYANRAFYTIQIQTNQTDGCPHGARFSFSLLSPWEGPCAVPFPHNGQDNGHPLFHAPFFVQNRQACWL